MFRNTYFFASFVPHFHCAAFTFVNNFKSMHCTVHIQSQNERVWRTCEQSPFHLAQFETVRGKKVIPNIANHFVNAEKQ